MTLAIATAGPGGTATLDLNGHSIAPADIAMYGLAVQRHEPGDGHDGHRHAELQSPAARVLNFITVDGRGNPLPATISGNLDLMGRPALDQRRSEPHGHELHDVGGHVADLDAGHARVDHLGEHPQRRHYEDHLVNSTGELGRR